MANAIKKSIEIAKSMYSAGYRYLYGAKGQEYTSALVRQLRAMYPAFVNHLISHSRMSGSR